MTHHGLEAGLAEPAGEALRDVAEAPEGERVEEDGASAEHDEHAGPEGALGDDVALVEAIEGIHDVGEEVALVVVVVCLL